MTFLNNGKINIFLNGDAGGIVTVLKADFKTHRTYITNTNHISVMGIGDRSFNDYYWINISLTEFNSGPVLIRNYAP